jgi:rSAM/selenodomain-associated transferase 1
VYCIFAKEPARAKTRLRALLSEDGAAKLAQALLEDTLLLVPAPRHVWADGPLPAGIAVDATQVGADLGARLHSAMAAELAAGAAAVVVVGSDSPTLPVAVLAEAHRVLDEGRCDLALGPAADGGYYLIGATAAGLRSELFAGIHWSSADVLRQTFVRAVSARLRTHVCPWWYDVDTPADLALLEAHLATLPPTVAPRTRAFLATRQTP